MALLLGAAGLGRGEDGGKPFAVISLASYDRINGDLEIVGKAVGNPMLPKSLEMVIAAATQQKGLAGLDKARPWGAVFQEREPGLPGLRLPAGHGPQRTAGRPPGTLGGPAKHSGDGVYEVSTPARPLFAKQKGSWVVRGLQSRRLEGHARRSAAAAGRSAEEVQRRRTKVSVGNIPPALRETLLSRLKQGAAAAARRKGDEGFSPEKQWEGFREPERRDGRLGRGDPGPGGRCHGAKRVIWN